MLPLNKGGVGFRAHLDLQFQSEIPFWGHLLFKITVLQRTLFWRHPKRRLGCYSALGKHSRKRMSLQTSSFSLCACVFQRPAHPNPIHTSQMTNEFRGNQGGGLPKSSFDKRVRIDLPLPLPVPTRPPTLPTPCHLFSCSPQEHHPPRTRP